MTKPPPPGGATAEVGTRAFWLVLVALTGYLFYLLGPVLTPFLLALMIAYIFEKVVARLAAHGLSRSTAAAIVLLLIILAAVAMVLILLPLLQQQLARITETMPRFFEWARTTVEPMIEQHLGLADHDGEHGGCQHHQAAGHLGSIRTDDGHGGSTAVVHDYASERRRFNSAWRYVVENASVGF